MPITVLDVETTLNSRCGALMVLVGKDPTPTSGSASAPYLDALFEGLASLNLTPVSFSAVVDADLALIANKDIPQFKDVSELRLLASIVGAFTQVDETISLGSQKNSQNRQGITDKYNTLAAFVKEKYGYGLGNLGAGSIDLGFDSERRWGWGGYLGSDF